MKNKIKNQDFDGYSWIEFFFNSHVHILGLSLDYSETDLWWLLNKRARLMLDNEINNKIYYYDSDIDPAKETLLKSMSVIVCNVPRKNGYVSAHNELIEKLKTNKKIKD